MFGQNTAVTTLVELKEKQSEIQQHASRLLFHTRAYRALLGLGGGFLYPKPYKENPKP